MKSVLFVCTANRCRSPMAEALLKAKVAKLDQANDWQISSAGTWTEEGLLPLPLARQTMTKRGLDIGAHRSRPVDAALLEANSVILVITHSHREGLSVEFPTVASTTSPNSPKLKTTGVKSQLKIRPVLDRHGIKNRAGLGRQVSDVVSSAENLRNFHINNKRPSP